MEEVIPKTESMALSGPCHSPTKDSKSGDTSNASTLSTEASISVVRRPSKSKNIDAEEMRGGEQTKLDQPFLGSWMQLAKSSDFGDDPEMITLKRNEGEAFTVG